MHSGKGAALYRLRRVAAPLGMTALCLLLANCNSRLASKLDPRYGVSASPRVVEFGQPVPKGGGVYRVGKPYQVAGRTYTPAENANYRDEGLASWYGTDFHGRLTANGEVFDMESISAAHPTLPIPSYARVTNLATKRSLIVRVNDRGPYHANRIIDVSHKAAELLGFRQNGVARVRVEYVGPASLDGSDDRKLIATLRDGGQPAPMPTMVASAGAFALRGSPSPALRGDIPVPPDRPYGLGQERPEASGAISTDLAAMSRNSRTASAARSDVSPVSAYASTRYSTPSAFNGRGLY